MTHHKSLTKERWQTFSLFEQMGNIGSEVGRAIHARNPQDKKSATCRALELFDLTLSDERWYGRGSEIARAREVVCDYLYGGNNYRSDPKSLEQYFIQFAIAARLNK